MTQAILTLNAGSSSIKFALFELGDDEPFARIRGKIENIGYARPHLVAKDASGEILTERHWTEDGHQSHETLFGWLFDWIDEHLAPDELIESGHRVVHGGSDFYEPALVTPALIDSLEKLCSLAPLHQPHNLAAIKAVAATRPNLSEVASFDTGFHHNQPTVATRFAIPRAMHDEGIRRYGFHGLSYEYIARQLRQIDPELTSGRIVVAHLGNGASLCAMKNGRSVDTTMGFTALDGLIMGTRCGTIDPGVPLYLIQQKGMSAGEVSKLLYNPIRTSACRAFLTTCERFWQAMMFTLPKQSTFTYRIARETGALTASLDGIDGFVFTAGIGENAAEVRLKICQRLGWLGVQIDETANRTGEDVISLADSKVTVRIIPTDEERMIAIHTLDILGRNS